MARVRGRDKEGDMLIFLRAKEWCFGDREISQGQARYMRSSRRFRPQQCVESVLSYKIRERKADSANNDTDI